jgi:hypothetical protein
MTYYFDAIQKALPQLRRPVELDEFAASEKIRRGAAADRLLKDDDLSEAFTDVNRVYMDAWAQSDALDVETRERAWIATRLLADLRNALLSRVRDGKAAQKQLEQAARGASAFST